MHREPTSSTGSVDSARPSPRWTRLDWLALSGLTLVAGILRAVRLMHPSVAMGDEEFYGIDGCWYAFHSKAVCGTGHEINLEHPPLAKWIMSMAMHVGGPTLTSQRIPSVIFGTLSIVVFYLLARRLLRSTLGATIASGGLAIDFMHFVHSRTGMLDIYLLFFVVLALLFLVYDRDRLFSERATGRLRPWRVAAGAAAGAATATKWTGLLVLVTLVFLSVAWESSRRRDRPRRLLTTVREQGLGMAVAFLITPALVYAVTFLGRVDSLGALLLRQEHIFKFHAHHIWEHYNGSAPWSWPLTKRGAPLIYLARDAFRIVVDTGNTVIWVLSIVALVYIAVRWARSQDPTRPEGFIVAGFMWAYPPWLVYALVPFVFFTWGRSALFIWYMLPALPFMYLALGYVAIDLAKRSWGRIVIGAVALFAVAAFAFYYPVIAYVPMTRGQLDARLFAFEHCERRPHEPFIFFKRRVVNGSVRFTEQIEPAAPHLEPLGWCWLP
jgi:predicted membrane-bound dolichyl-phosphate-mannose-protein mannosyltransferase